MKKHICIEKIIILYEIISIFQIVFLFINLKNKNIYVRDCQFNKMNILKNFYEQFLNKCKFQYYIIVISYFFSKFYF